MPLFNNVLAGAAGQSGGDAGYKVQRSLRFNPGENSHLTKTFSSSGNRKTFTLSYWIKESGKGTSPSNNPHILWSGADVNTRGGIVHRGTGTNANKIYLFNQESGSTNCQVFSNSLHRDFSAWKNIVWAIDTTQSSATNRVKLYVNGVQETLNFVTTPAQNLELQINLNQEHRIGRGFPDDYGNCMLAEMHFVDGQALAASDFGEYSADTGAWNPIEYTGTYGPSAVTYGNNNQITIDSGNYYLNSQDGPNGFDGNSSTYIDCRLGTGSNNTTNIIFQPTGGIANVTKIRVNSNYADDYRINNGTWTSFSSGGSYTQIYSGSAFTLTKLEIRRTSNGGSDYGHRVTAYEINDSELVDIANEGRNGFHLDFSDNSSISALGNDAAGSNNWTPNNFQVDSRTYATGALTAVNGVLAPLSDPFWIDILPTNADMHYASSTNTDNMKLVHDGLTTTSAYWVGNLNSPSYGGNVTRARFDLTSFGTITSCRVYGGFVTGYVNYKYRMLDSSKTEISGSEGTFGGPSWHTMQVTGSPKYIEISCEHTTSTNTRHRTYAIEVNGNVLVNGGPYLNASFFDTPTNYDDGTNVGGNYCVMNPLAKGPNCTLSNGNLDITTQADPAKCLSTIGMSSGKWYSEFTCTNNSPNPGLATQKTNLTSGFLGNDENGWVYGANGKKYHNDPGATGVTYGASYTNGDVIGVAFDADAGTLTFYKNGTSQGAAYTGLTSGPYFFATGGSYSSSVANFGQRPFAISSVPTGFKPLCTQNLDDPLIAKGSDHFDVSLWTGNGQQMTVGGPIYSASADSGVTNAGKMFNGISNDGGYYNGTGTNKVITTTPFTITSQLRVYNNFRSDGTYAICLNDSCIDVPGSGTSSANFRWSTIDLSSFSLPLDVTKLGYSLSQNSGNTIALIEVDGNVLIDGNGDPLDFSPDLVWLKSRSTTAYHMVFDTMRGVEARLHPNTTSASQTGNGDLTAFNSNGYTLDNATGSTNTDVNGSGTSYVGWSWDGGDLATNSAYNQSEVWSDGWVLDSGSSWISGPELSFDGFTGTNTTQTRINGGATWTAGTAVPFTTSLRIWGFDAGSGSIEINGTDVSSQVTDGTSGVQQWNTITGITSPLSTIRITGTTANTCGIGAVEVDGKILVDTGVIPIGSLNSSIYDQSQTWSGLWSGTAGYGSFTNLHDADDTDYAQSTNATLTFSSAIALNSLQIRHSSNFGTATLSVNGTDVTSQLPTTGTKPLTTITGFTSLSSISMSGADYQANVHTLYEIFVNGKKLIDSGVSVADAPAVASTVRVNQSAGFSIVKVDNPTATESRAHGLNKKPDFIICKSTASADSWHTYHSSLGYTKYINLNSTSGAATSDQFGSQEPDSNLFYVKTSTGSGANKSGGMVYFIWTAVEGYSAFTSHTVRSGTNFVYLGFRPRFLMLKRTGEGSSTNMGFASWAMFDTERDTFNEVDFDTILYANVSHAEGKRGDGGGSTGGTYLNIDILSNGIRFQSGAAEFSQPNDVTLVCAWAEHPLKYGRAR